MNKKILIVDDEPKNLKILRIRLESDFELIEAKSGEEALVAVKEHRPALVLLDIMMDGIDGIEVTKTLKADPELSSTKIILVTGKANVEDRLAGYHAGAEDYIIKPFNGDELRAKVNVFINLYNLELKLNISNQSLEEEIQLRSNQLLKSERMAFVGLKAGEIVHNLKGPLSIIKGYTKRLNKIYPGQEELSKINKATDRILDIIGNILSNFDHDMKSDLNEFNISEIIEAELDFLSSVDTDYKNRVETDIKFESHHMIKASRSHISQIISNIIKNAVEAMLKSEKRVLSIHTADFNKFVLVKVKDTGMGISKENIQRIFEPLFTTKDGKDGEPQGTGLGLPFCKRMIESYGGSLIVESEEGVGTTVIIKLPIFIEH